MSSIPNFSGRRKNLENINLQVSKTELKRTEEMIELVRRE